MGDGQLEIQFRGIASAEGGDAFVIFIGEPAVGELLLVEPEITHPFIDFLG